mgnify:CR=1 FL=1
MRCPVCDELIRSKARKCKHCLTIFTEDADQREYLEQAFLRIERELTEFERKIERIVGWLFKRHQFTKDELRGSPHIAKIDSITRKIQDDLHNWSANGMLGLRTRNTYNTNAESVHQRLDSLILRIESRRNTKSEMIGHALREFGVFLRSTLLPFLKDTVLINGRKLKKLPSPKEILNASVSGLAR